jgi:xanthine dehydrogenase small subunit
MREEPSPTVDFVLNGTRVKVSGVPPATTLLEWLRAEGHTGTKEGCAEGDCGACTVALRTPADDGDGLVTRAVNACIMALPMAHGAEVVTVEGIGDPAAPHPVQREMAERHGSQCGFCTPGIVMSLWSREPGEPADRQATEDRLAGNLCRCTGYGPILEAARHSAGPADALRDPARDRATAEALRAAPPLDYSAGGRRFLAPHTEEGFAAALAENPDARILSGATDVGLWITKDLYDPATILWTGRVGAFRRIVRDGDRLVVGAAVKHAEFHAAVAEESPQLAELMRRFGGLQVRNAGTVGGNIANGSPIGDLPPALIAAGATLELGHEGGTRTLPLEDYFIAYGKQDRHPGEYVRAVNIPLDGLRGLTCHKVSKRFDSDITAVLACIMLTIEDGIVDEARIAFGGMAATPKRAPHAEAALAGRPYERAEVDNAAAALAEDFAPITDLRASAAYRLKVAQNLLRRDHLERTDPEAATRLAGQAIARVAA